MSTPKPAGLKKTATDPTGAEPGLAVKLRFLASAASHPGLRHRPRCVQTHMSWLVLAGERVYKLKKPVRFPFLDFSTLNARAFYCREELRLNSRLAPGVYLGLYALQMGAEGRLALRAEGQLAPDEPVVEWLVCMRRLPQRRNLLAMIQAGRLRAADVDTLADVLVGFYRRATRVRVDPAEFVARLEREQAANREVLLRPQFALGDAARTLERLGAGLMRQSPTLRRRAAAGRLVDGHGDLRPEHVYLLDPPVVIDGLEFSTELREVDPYDELAFLGLECALAGAEWVAERLFTACASGLGEPAPPRALLSLYAARRAVLRARLAMAHLLDPRPRTPRKWPALAQRYLDAASHSLDDMAPRPTVSAATRRGTA